MRGIAWWILAVIIMTVALVAVLALTLIIVPKSNLPQWLSPYAQTPNVGDENGSCGFLDYCKRGLECKDGICVSVSGGAEASEDHITHMVDICGRSTYYGEPDTKYLNCTLTDQNLTDVMNIMTGSGYEGCNNCNSCKGCEVYFNFSNAATCSDCEDCDNTTGGCSYCADCNSAVSDKYSTCWECYECASCLNNQGSAEMGDTGLADSCSSCALCLACNKTNSYDTKGWCKDCADCNPSKQNCFWCSECAASSRAYSAGLLERENFVSCEKCSSCSGTCQYQSEPAICQELKECIRKMPGGICELIDLPHVSNPETVRQKLLDDLSECKGEDIKLGLAEFGGGGEQKVCKLPNYNEIFVSSEMIPPLMQYVYNPVQNKSLWGIGNSYYTCGDVNNTWPAYSMVYNNVTFGNPKSWHTKVVVTSIDWSEQGSNICKFAIGVCSQPTVVDYNQQRPNPLNVYEYVRDFDLNKHPFTAHVVSPDKSILVLNPVKINVGSNVDAGTITDSIVAGMRDWELFANVPDTELYNDTLFALCKQFRKLDGYDKQSTIDNCLNSTLRVTLKEVTLPVIGAVAGLYTNYSYEEVLVNTTSDFSFKPLSGDRVTDAGCSADCGPLEHCFSRNCATDLVTSCNASYPEQPCWGWCTNHTYPVSSGWPDRMSVNWETSAACPSNSKIEDRKTTFQIGDLVGSNIEWRNIASVEHSAAKAWHSTQLTIGRTYGNEQPWQFRIIDPACYVDGSNYCSYDTWLVELAIDDWVNKDVIYGPAGSISGDISLQMAFHVTEKCTGDGVSPTYWLGIKISCPSDHPYICENDPAKLCRDSPARQILIKPIIAFEPAATGDTGSGGASSATWASWVTKP